MRGWQRFENWIIRPSSRQLEDMRLPRFGACIAFLSVALAGCDTHCTTGSVAGSGLSELQRDAVRVGVPWADHARICRMAGYVVIGPADGASGELFITRQGTTVAFEGPHEIHVKSPAGSLVSIQDIDGTGRFNWISYTAVDPKDGLSYSMTDDNADGTLDTKIGDKAGFVNIDGQWARFEKREGQLGAIVAGEWKPLEKQGRIWRVRTP